MSVYSCCTLLQSSAYCDKLLYVAFLSLLHLPKDSHVISKNNIYMYIYTFVYILSLMVCVIFPLRSQFLQHYRRFQRLIFVPFNIMKYRMYHHLDPTDVNCHPNTMQNTLSILSRKEIYRNKLLS